MAIASRITSSPDLIKPVVVFFTQRVMTAIEDELSSEAYELQKLSLFRLLQSIVLSLGSGEKV